MFEGVGSLEVEGEFQIEYLLDGLSKNVKDIKSISEKYWRPPDSSPVQPQQDKTAMDSNSNHVATATTITTIPENHDHLDKNKNTSCIEETVEQLENAMLSDGDSDKMEDQLCDLDDRMLNFCDTNDEPANISEEATVRKIIQLQNL